MKRITEWCDRIKQSHFWENKWICKWILLGVVFSVVVHILFSFSGPEWLQAKWGAGDLLSYVGTVSLGLLALWQNKRFKEENDKAQERLGELSQQANELAIISKILEHEEQRIRCVKDTLQKFEKITYAPTILGIASKSWKNGTIVPDMVGYMDSLKIIFGDLLEQLFNDPFTSSDELRDIIDVVYGCANTLARNFTQCDKKIDEKLIEASSSKLKESNLKYVSLKFCYVQSIVEMHHHLLYDNVSLAEIKKLRAQKGERPTDNQSDILHQLSSKIE